MKSVPSCNPDQGLCSFKVDLRSGFERSEDPESLLVEDAELRVSKRQGSIAQVKSNPYWFCGIASRAGGKARLSDSAGRAC